MNRFHIQKAAEALLRQEGGFTLLEMLIALTIFSIVGVATFALLKTGIFAYRRIEASKQFQIARRIALDRLENDLQNLTARSLLPFSGDERGIRLAAQSHDSSAALQEIQWRFAENATGEQKFLLRIHRDLKSEKARIDTMLQNLREWRFEYLAVDTASSRWLDAWQDPLRLPGAVRVQFAFASDDPSHTALFNVHRGAAFGTRARSSVNSPKAAMTQDLR